MRKRFRFIGLSSWLAVSFFNVAFADDLSGILDVLNQLYGVQSQQLPHLAEMEQTSNAILQNLQGQYGYGGWQNHPADLKARQWMNDNWEDALNETSSSNTQAFLSAQKAYDALYPVEKPSEMGNGLANTLLSKTSYGQTASVNRAALAASKYSLNTLNQHLEAVHDLLASLNHQTSEKASLDLNARITAEVAFIQLELLRQQTIQNQVIATRSESEVTGMSNENQFLK